MYLLILLTAHTLKASTLTLKDLPTSKNGHCDDLRAMPGLFLFQGKFEYEIRTLDYRTLQTFYCSWVGLCQNLSKKWTLSHMDGWMDG